MANMDISERVSQIEEAIRGDLKGNPGILQNLIRVMNDIYHPEEGLKQKMRHIEDEKIRNAAWFAGVTWLSKLIWAGLGAVLILIIKAFFKIV